MGERERRKEEAYYFGKLYSTLLFCRVRFWHKEFGWNNTRSELRHAWAVIPPLLSWAHECICNQTHKGSDLSIALPGPAEMTVMNWRLYIYYHSNKHHHPRATPWNLCKCRFPIKPNPWEIVECWQKQQDPPQRHCGWSKTRLQRKPVQLPVPRNSSGEKTINSINFSPVVFFSCEVCP